MIQHPYTPRNLQALQIQRKERLLTTSSSPIPNLIYFPDLKDALKSHMHATHRLGYADCKTG
eukprot:158676-Pelagomonas_calceolata.AAC.1